MLELLVAAEAATENPAQTLLHHLADNYDWESGNVHHLLGTWAWHGIDFTPTRMALMVMLSAVVLVAVLWASMRRRGAVPRGRLQNTVEMLFLFVRDEIAGQTIEHDAARYVPYLASTFFFITVMNLSGLFPAGSTPTSNMNVTFVLAAVAFLMIQLAGIRSKGVAGFFKSLVPPGIPGWIYPLMLLVEILGIFTKPFALMVRLFANMLAGHVGIYFIIGLIFIIHALGVAIPALALALALLLLEIFICLLQAYIFTMLTSLFIGLSASEH